MGGWTLSKESVIARINTHSPDKYTFDRLTDDTYDGGDYIILTCVVHGDFRNCVKTVVLGAGGCPRCLYPGRFLNENAPELFAQIDREWFAEHFPDKNINNIRADSPKKIGWRCPNDHTWQIRISARYLSWKRNGELHDCPRCRSLAFLYPHLLDEIDKEKNPGFDPWMVLAGSSQKIWWKCERGHSSYKAGIHVRACANPTGCRRCYVIAKETPPPGKSLGDLCPRALEEWDYELNIGTPYDYRQFSCYHVARICRTCGNKWWSEAGSLNYHGCKQCMKRNYSKVAIKWLTRIMEIDGIHIQHAENGGEFRIPGTAMYADGYCKETNTVYEFHGDCWHGNPLMYHVNDRNPINFKRYGDLYIATLEKENLIRSMGYNLITVWESEYKEWLEDYKKAVIAAPIALAYIIELLNK